MRNAGKGKMAGGHSVLLSLTDQESLTAVQSERWYPRSPHHLLGVKRGLIDESAKIEEEGLVRVAFTAC